MFYPLEMAKVRGKLAGASESRPTHSRCVEQLLSLSVKLNAEAHSALFTCLGDFWQLTPCSWCKSSVRGQIIEKQLQRARRPRIQLVQGKQTGQYKNLSSRSEQQLSPQLFLLTKENTFYSLNLLVLQ